MHKITVVVLDRDKRNFFATTPTRKMHSEIAFFIGLEREATHKGGKLLSKMILHVPARADDVGRLKGTLALGIFPDSVLLYNLSVVARMTGVTVALPSKALLGTAPPVISDAEAMPLYTKCFTPASAAASTRPLPRAISEGPPSLLTSYSECQHEVMVGSIKGTYRIVRVGVHENAPAILESFNHLVLGETIGLDNFNALFSKSLGFFRIRVAGDAPDLEALGLVLDEGGDNTTALRASGAVDCDELLGRHDEGSRVQRREGQVIVSCLGVSGMVVVR